MTGFGEAYNPPLQVVGFVATKRDEEDRGPQVRIRSDDARRRLIEDGELVWIKGPRRQELAPVVYDDSIPRGGIVVRDIVGVAPSEIVRLVKVDFDRPRPPGFA